MITGYVTQQLEAKVQLIIEYGNGQSFPIDAVVDTGFSGFLCLPTSIIASLGLPWIVKIVMLLADGSSQEVNVHEGTVIWDGQPRTIRINAVGADPLIGMKMLAGHEVCIRVVGGGRVWIDIVP